MLQAATEDLIAHIRGMWRRGLKANRQPIKRQWRKKAYWGYFPRKLTRGELAEYQRQALTGQLRAPRFEKQKSDFWKKMKRRRLGWTKRVKKLYTYKGEVFMPNANKRPGNWSGLLNKSLGHSPIRVSSRTGKVPQKCNVRLQVAPSRGVYVRTNNLMKMGPASYPMASAKRRIKRNMKQQTIIRSHKQRTITKFDLVLLWRKYKMVRSLLAKVGM